ncbi:MAG: ATP-dependent zinc protease [Bacteroidia bacterium]|nr:ATP-dependent zinc protease [Bacteroidia bacterium]
MQRRTRSKRTIGITDYIDLPEAGILNIPCKIDSGADTSAVHCERVRIKEIDGVDHLVFKLLDRKHPLYTGKDIVTSQFKEKKVKSSFGDYEFRYQVKLKMTIFNRNYTVSFNLSNRKNMRYPVLLGRKFLNNRFIIDVSKMNLSYNMKNDTK